ncbi:hypothetical protein PoB_007255500 [Plakobranchus ocellatus]|uniref:Uncharacterized protein n=1 Tax=Plakobranchus ocellatus TaxID=259542 RepID=A0AAV4DPR0_9GAST|nr:hypothetical protein PoB_007255500 [Plakobranchus ocellatus]
MEDVRCEEVRMKEILRASGAGENECAWKLFKSNTNAAVFGLHFLNGNKEAEEEWAWDCLADVYSQSTTK